MGETALDVSARLPDEEAHEILAQYLFNQSFRNFNDHTTASSNLRVNFPFILSSPGLCKSIYESVDTFYSLLDKLDNPGFVLGMDYVRNDIPLADPMDLEMFTGIIQEDIQGAQMA